MTGTKSKPISIAPNHNTATLAKGQKAFNALVKQIEKRRARLAAWEVALPEFHRKHLSESVPLEETLYDLHEKMVRLLDKASTENDLNKSERRTLAMVITDMAGDLIVESDDPELKAIYNRHSETDFDSETAVELDDMKSMVEALFDVQLDDNAEIKSPDDLLRYAQAQVEQQQAQESAEDLAREERRAKRKKSPKQVAAEARAQAEQAQLSLSIREVYRKLASALHPDREIDPQERERKNALMQRVNQAYNKNSLLQLLELQLELEHIDQSAINNISEDRLKHYNKILKEQVSELDQEIFHVEYDFRESYGLPPFTDVSPDNILPNLALEISLLQEKIDILELDLVRLQDIKALKALLKQLAAATKRGLR
jgi:hypothetical protein